MIDIHSHILPYVDDGADNIVEAIEMLRMSKYSNTSAIVVTPHSNLYEYDKNLLAEMKQVFDAFRQKEDVKAIGIDLYLGGEIFVNDDAMPLARQRALPTINDSRFMLGEFDFYESSSYIISKLNELVAMGYVPIVAHPERYECIKARINTCIDFMNCGALLQINKGSLAGDFGMSSRDIAFEMLNRRLAQFVASDCHSTGSRNPDMELTFDIVREEFGDKLATKLFEINPQAVINNGKLVIARPII